MTTWNRVSGDVGDTIVTTLNGVADLTGATVEAHVWQNGSPPVTLTAAVTDGPARQVTAALGAVAGQPWLPTATPNLYNLEWEVTLAGTTRTWPEKQPDIIKVRAQGD